MQSPQLYFTLWRIHTDSPEPFICDCYHYKKRNALPWPYNTGWILMLCPSEYGNPHLHFLLVGKCLTSSSLWATTQGLQGLETLSNELFPLGSLSAPSVLDPTVGSHSILFQLKKKKKLKEKFLKTLNFIKIRDKHIECYLSELGPLTTLTSCSLVSGIAMIRTRKEISDFIIMIITDTSDSP